jgi:transcriptional regulator GlxA family with amidase domain
VLARAGLLDGRRATGHWYSRDDLQKKYPRADWQQNHRYVSDGRVVTTTGVTATIPVSLALVEAIAGRERALGVARTLGGEGMSWSAKHPSERFKLDWSHRFTIAGNFMAFWSHRELGIPLEAGVDEIALALQAEVHSATYKSTAYTVAASAAPVRSKRGLMIVPDRVAADAPARMLPAPDGARPLRALEQALRDIKADYGADTAGVVALQMEYPGY